MEGTAEVKASTQQAKLAMEKGGVKGTPQIWYATRATK